MFFPRTVLYSTLCSVTVLLACAGSPAAVLAQDPVGLNGILPDAPEDVINAIDALPPSWKGWGDELGKELAALYGGEAKTVEDQRALLGKLHARVDTLGKFGVDPRYAGGRTVLLTLKGRLKRRLDLYDAALDTLLLPESAKSARMDAVQGRLASAAADLREYLTKVYEGEKWGKFLDVTDSVEIADTQQKAAILFTANTRFEREDLSEAQKAFLLRPAVANYKGALADFLAVTANIETLADNGAVRKALKDFFDAYENYRIPANRTAANAQAVRTTFDAVRSSAIDGGERMTQAVRIDVMNYNLRVVGTEAFLSRFIGEERSESGVVDDCILGAKVDGCQFTNSTIWVDLVPSEGSARFDLTVNATISAQTQGAKDCAKVFTQGNHLMFAQKRVIFDGDQYFTEQVRVSANPHNTTVGARTFVSWVPLLGRLSEKIAMDEAEKLAPEAHAIAAQRIISQAAPRLDAEVDRQFGPEGEVNGKFGERMQALRDKKMYPDARSVRSTDTELFLSTRLMASGEVGGAEPVPSGASEKSVVIQIHESLLNNAADRFGFHGKKMTEDQFRDEIARQMSELTGKAVEPPPNTRDPNEKVMIFVFDKDDPIRVRIDDGFVFVTLRAAIERDGEEGLPPHAITTSFQYEIKGDKVLMNPGSVSVVPLGNGNPVQSATVKSLIEKRLKPREESRVIKVDRNGKNVDVTITDINPVDGWITIIAE